MNFNLVQATLLTLFLFVSPGLFSQSYTEVEDTFYVPTPEYSATLQIDSLHFPCAITTPDQGTNFPILILVHGSAALDKDANSTKDYQDTPSGPVRKARTRMFYEIADSLSRNGIMVLRYDKRSYTINCIEKPTCWWADTIIPRDYIRDLDFAIEFAKTLPQADTCNIFLAGHSQGASFVADAGRRRNDVRGILFLAGTAQPIDTVAVFQKLSVDNDPPGAAILRSQFDSLRAGAWPMTDTLYQAQFSPRFWLDWISITDSATIAPQLSQVPTYFLYGDNDKLVPSAIHMPIWMSSQSGSSADFHIFPNLDHSFGIMTDSVVQPTVPDTLSAWIHRTAVACPGTWTTDPKPGLRILAYPNPVADRLHFSPVLPAATFTIRNLQNRICAQGIVTRDGIDLRSLATGAYLVCVQTRNGVFRKMIVKR